MDEQPQPQPQSWPPRWARTVGFAFGLGLMGYEAIFDHSQNIILYGPAFALTGLPIATGIESLITSISSLLKGGK